MSSNNIKGIIGRRFHKLILTGLIAVTPFCVNSKTITFTIGAAHPTASTYVEAIDKFFIPKVVDEVKKQTGDDVKFIRAYGGSVAKGNEVVSAVEDGTLDIGASCFCFEQAKLFLQGFPYWIPFSSPDPRVMAKATRAVYEKYPILKDQFTDKYNQRLIGLSGYDSYGLVTRFPWTDLDQLSGHKIAAAGVNMAWLNGTGATGVTVIATQGYNALLTGVFDGWVLYASDYAAYKIYEVGKYFTLVNFGAPVVNGLMINLDVYNKLSPTIQKIIDDAGSYYEEQQAQLLYEKSTAAIEKAKSLGATVTEPSDEVRAKWASNMKDLPWKMVDEADSRVGEGSRASAESIVKEYIKAQEALGYKFPVNY